jgi:hypothetical protein
LEGRRPSKNPSFPAPVGGYAADWCGKWMDMERLRLPKPFHHVTRNTFRMKQGAYMSIEQNKALARRWSEEF